MNFLNKIEKFDSNTCFFTDDKRRVSYQDVLKNSETLSKNLKPRALIFVLADNNIEFFNAYVGFFRKGLVQTLLNPKISTSLLQELIESYRPSYIFAPNSRTNDFKNYEILDKSDNYIIFKLNNDNNYSINKDLAFS